MGAATGRSACFRIKLAPPPSPGIAPSTLRDIRDATMRETYRLLCLAALLSTTLVPVSAVDTLAAGQSLRDNQTLVSAEGSFALGFFITPASKSRYLGIWYNRLPGRTVVWVANRQRPLRDPEGLLSMSLNGTLLLTDGAGTIYWSTGPAREPLSSPAARLLNDANLVVLEERGRSGYAWQSFAYPADTILPNVYVGPNRLTGVYLTAWRTPDDPSPGDYTCGLDTRGVPQLFVKRGSTPVFRGGPWVGEHFTGIPRMKDSPFFNFVFRPKPEDNDFKYDVWNKSVVARIVLQPSGTLEHLIWDSVRGSWFVHWASANDTCDRFGACGPYGLCDARTARVCSCPEGFVPKQPAQWERGAVAAGCERGVPLECRSGRGAFVVVSGAKLPDTTAAVAQDAGGGLEGCRAGCLRNCSCTAFSFGGGSGCITWSGDLTDIKLYGDGGQDLYVRVASTGGGDKEVSWKVIMIAIVLITSIAMIILMLICLRRRQIGKRRLKEIQQAMGEQHHNESDNGNDLELPLFHFKIIELATDNFSIQNKLGEGGYGPVYKGKLHDGRCIAVKRLSKHSTQGIEQFKSEVQLVAKLQHINLVRLLGCCIENEEKILLYEYMSNQSLDKFLFDANRGRQLDWTKRLHIIEGITQGLLYLHKYSRLRVIHRDLKASNILLDDELNPKISDFGLARIFSWNEPQSNTKHIIGTYGYMPPEFAMNGIFSVKSDVFSFGVLLLEILSGKKNTSIAHFGLSQNLQGHAWELWLEGKELELMDPNMDNLFPRNEFSRCIHVALLCVQENPMDRPTMLDVVTMFNSDTTTLPTPNQPAFFLVRHPVMRNHTIEKNQFVSSNDVTLTWVEGR